MKVQICPEVKVSIKKGYLEWNSELKSPKLCLIPDICTLLANALLLVATEVFQKLQRQKVLQKKKHQKKAQQMCWKW